MAQLSRAVTAAVAILILLGPPAHVRGQDRKVLSPEVTKERRVVFRLQAPNAKSVQVQGDLTAKTHDMTKDDKGVCRSPPSRSRRARTSTGTSWTG